MRHLLAAVAALAAPVAVAEPPVSAVRVSQLGLEPAAGQRIVVVTRAAGPVGSLAAAERLPAASAAAGRARASPSRPTAPASGRPAVKPSSRVAGLVSVASNLPPERDEPGWANTRY